MPKTVAEEEDEEHVLRKLKPKIPDHNDAHPVAENMKIRRDSGLRKWRESEPYSIRWRTIVDYGFYTKNNKISMRKGCLTRNP